MFKKLLLSTALISGLFTSSLMAKVVSDNKIIQQKESILKQMYNQIKSDPRFLSIQLKGRSLIIELPDKINSKYRFASLINDKTKLQEI